MLGSEFSPWPSFTDEEVDAVAKVMRSNRVNYWTGEAGRQFETEFAAWCGTEYAVAVSNGTVALELALEALGVGGGDEVIVTSRTFLASASAIVRRGATPIFADIDHDSQNITRDSVAAVATERTTAVIAVHLAGQPCDMDGLMSLAETNGWSIIEDCAQAHGARYKGRSVGSIGHAGAWSFCQDKIMSTGGEGGMVTTNSDALRRAIWSLKDHGKTISSVYETEHPQGYRWLHEKFGSNYRMTELQAEIGRIQLGRMADWGLQRAENAQRIRSAAEKSAAFRVPPLRCNRSCPTAGCSGCAHAHYKCYIFVELSALAQGWSRDSIQQEIQDAGVPCMSGSCSEIYLEKAFDGHASRPKERLPIAKQLGETSLMFLVHPTLTESEVQRTCDVILSVGRMATCDRTPRA